MDSNLSIKSNHNFTVTADELSGLYELEAIRNSISIGKIHDAYGGPHGLLDLLKTSTETGIQSSTISLRDLKFGKNKPPLKPISTLFQLVFESFEDLTLRFLAFASIILIVLNISERPEKALFKGIGILVAIPAVVLVTSFINYLKEHKLLKLKKEAEERHMKVIRDSSEKSISVLDLVVGDIVKVEAGDIMPVDGLVLWSEDLMVDESTITGELGLIFKDHEHSPFLLSSSQIVEGNAVIVVLAVGTKTISSKICDSITHFEDETTPLQNKLNKVAESIGKYGLLMVLIIFLLLFGYQIYDAIQSGWSSSVHLTGIFNSFIFVVTLVFVAVPEGFPSAVTLCIAHSVNEMKKKNTLVRKLSAIETMGQVTQICTDRTGILTQNCMEVFSMCIGKDEILVDLNKSQLNQEVINHLGLHFCHSTSACIEYSEGKEIVTGSLTDIALQKLGKAWGFDYEKYRSPDKIKIQVPFNSRIKKNITVVEEGGNHYVFIKGASQVIVNMCEKYINKGGQTHELDENEKTKINDDVILNPAFRNCRTQGLSYRIVDKEEWKKFLYEDGAPDIEALEKHQILLAIIGFQEPVRSGVPEAIRKCQSAGIAVRMITGDSIETALAFAKSCGIVDKVYKYEEGDFVVMSGQELIDILGGINEVRNLENFKEIAFKLRVLARSSPQDKLTLVNGLRNFNEVVAVTGGGTNDAPALRKSNIGFSMNIAGTQLAKQASDIILLDDNFTSIFTAVLWGRNIYDCMSRLIQFQLTVIIITLSISFIGSLILNESPITAIQILWVSLIMETFAALVLAARPPHDYLLDRQPVKDDESLITADMIKTIIGQCFYQLTWLIFILFGMKYFSDGLFEDIYINRTCKNNITYTENNNSAKIHGQECLNNPHLESTNYPYTIFFQAFMMMQFFNVIDCRNLKSSELNVFSTLFNSSFFLIIFVQFIIVEFGGDFFQVESLTLKQNLFCIAVGAGGLIFNIVFRFVPIKVFGFRSVKVE